jgi:hypothetical protein
LIAFLRGETENLELWYQKHAPNAANQ